MEVDNMERIPVPHEAEWIIEKIRERGFEAFAVGGCVRDTLLFREPGDWDITTSAKPEEIKAIFPKTVDTGLKHGTVTVIKNRKGYEVTTYRIDGEYRDGRHPESVEFTANLEEDLKRRDFTINAMAYSHETGIVDKFGGMEDLNHKVIRCVGRASDRFSEDALRILRAIRFSAQLGFSIEEETYGAIKQIAPNLGKVSKERIQAELTKLLLSDHPERILMVEERGISPFVTDGFCEAFQAAFGANNTGNLEAAGRFACISSLPAEKSLRWAGFLRFLPPAKAGKVLKELKLDNETIDNNKAMIAAYQAELPADKTAIRRLASTMTKGQLEGGLALKEMDGVSGIAGIKALWEEILADGDCLRLKDLAVGGSDLIALGLPPGKELGKALSLLLTLVLESPKLNKKDLLIEELKKRNLIFSR